MVFGHQEQTVVSIVHVKVTHFLKLLQGTHGAAVLLVEVYGP